MDYDYRTWGATKNCKGCRYWSEMLAQSIGCSGLQAMCLASAGPLKNKYTSGHMTCESWKEGDLGAIDDPGGDPYESEAA